MRARKAGTRSIPTPVKGTAKKRKAPVRAGTRKMPAKRTGRRSY